MILLAFSRLFGFFLIVSSVFLRSAAAEKAVVHIEDVAVSHRWVASSGKVFSVNWPLKSAWVWAPSVSDKLPIPIPLLRTSLHIPSSYSLESIEGVRPVSLDSKVVISRNLGKTVVFDSDQVPVTALMVLKHNKNGQTLRLNLIVTPALQSQVRHLWVHPDCGQNGLNLNEDVSPAQREYPRFVGLSCIDQGDALAVAVVHSSEVQRIEVRLTGREAETPTWLSARFSKPKDGRLKKITLGTFTVASVLTPQNKSSYSVLFSPTKQAPRFTWSAGLGFSYLKYHEDYGALDFSETGLTFNASAAYQLIPDLLDVDANAYLTALPLTMSLPDVSSARFYGINGRMGYRLPLALGSTTWHFLAGGYLWGMIVPGGAYGLPYLMGPQAFIQMRSQRIAHRSFFAYVKFAPISESFGMSASNREIAIGGGYQLSAAHREKPWMLTFDIADARFTSETAKNGFTLLTVTLGVSRAF